MAYFRCNQISLIEKTASGAVASFSDGIGGVPYSKLEAQIVATQEGTGDPSPQNVRAIHGYTGVNLTRAGVNMFDPDSTLTAWVNSNGSISDVASAKTVKIPFTAGESLVISNENAASGTNILLIAYFDKDNTMLSRNVTYSGEMYKAAQAPANTAYCIAGFYTWSETAKQQLEQGSTPTAYKPYEGDAYTVSWQDDAGTVYAGFIDLTTGLLTVTHGYVTIKEQVGLSFSKSSIETADTYYKNISSWVSNLVVSGYTEIVACDKYKPERSTNPNTIFIQNQYLNVRTPLNEYATAADFLTWVQTNGISFVFGLDTPQTYQLSATEVLALLGVNNVFNDTNGNTEVAYKAKP